MPLEFIGLEKLSLDNFNPIFIEKLLINLISFPRLFSLIINFMEINSEGANFYHHIFRLPVLKYCKFSYDFYRLYQILPVATSEISPIEISCYLYLR